MSTTSEMADWYRWRAALVLYTDGTPVQAGDRIRYHQAPGGMLPHGDWVYGVAPHLPEEQRYRRGFAIDELYLLTDNGRMLGLASHVIERDES